VPGAGSLVFAFGVYVAVAAHDIAAAYGGLGSPALLDGAFFPPLAVAVWQLADRFVAEARDLERGREELSRAAAERAREIDETAAAITRDARLASLGGFAGAVAHAINNPASVAAANLTHVLDVARSGGGDAAERREALRETREALDQVGQITRQLLRASRLAAAPGGGDVHVAEALDRAEALARERGQRHAPVAREIAPGLRVAVEGPVLAEVLANLLDELEDGGAGPHVRARAVLGRRAEIEVARAPDADAPSSRPARPPTPAGALRLSMCRALLVGHGADLTVHGAPGPAARYVVEVPLADDDRSGEAAA
jgi:signal transduction histidine kinase